MLHTQTPHQLESNKSQVSNFPLSELLKCKYRDCQWAKSRLKKRTMLARNWWGKIWKSADLLKLVNTEDSSCVTAMGADFLSEASGQSRIANWQLGWLHPLIAMVSRNGLLTGGNEVPLFHASITGHLATLADNLQEHNRNQRWISYQVKNMAVRPLLPVLGTAQVRYYCEFSLFWIWCSTSCKGSQGPGQLLWTFQSISNGSSQSDMHHPL